MPIITQSLSYLLLSVFLAFLWAPVLIALLHRFKLVRSGEYDFTRMVPGYNRMSKSGTPIMGGLLVVSVVAVITIVFNWTPTYTYVPIGVMGLAALLGGMDDVLNIYGVPRQVRSFHKTLTLIRVHRFFLIRLWYICTLPWVAFRSFWRSFGSHPGRGVQVHEKILLQFIAGAITAWWIYFKLGPNWQTIWIPFHGEFSIGVWIIPLVIFVVMFMANAVNVADGLDGLSGGSLLTAFGGLLVMSWFQGNQYFAYLNATMIGALLAYTYFNIKPARFQMGDVGSLAIGALLAVMAIAQNRILVLPLLGFVFVIELCSDIIQTFWRRVVGRRLLKMAPLHHHLEMMGWSEEKIVMRFWVLNAIAVFIGLWVSMH